MIRNTSVDSFRVSSAHHSSWRILTRLGQGLHDASARSIETHPSGVMVIYSTGDHTGNNRK